MISGTVEQPGLICTQQHSQFKTVNGFQQPQTEEDKTGNGTNQIKSLTNWSKRPVLFLGCSLMSARRKPSPNIRTEAPFFPSAHTKSH